MPKLQLFRPGDYGREIRTVLFDWYVAGENRSNAFELWWGKGETTGNTLTNLALKLKSPGAGGNLNGQELINAGYFYVSVNSGADKALSSTTVTLGTVALNKFLNVSIGLKTTTQLASVGPVFVELAFSLADDPLYFGSFQFSKETFGARSASRAESLNTMNPILLNPFLYDRDTYESMKAVGVKFPIDG